MLNLPQSEILKILPTRKYSQCQFPGKYHVMSFLTLLWIPVRSIPLFEQAGKKLQVISFYFDFYGQIILALADVNIAAHRLEHVFGSATIDTSIDPIIDRNAEYTRVGAVNTVAAVALNIHVKVGVHFPPV